MSKKSQSILGVLLMFIIAAAMAAAMIHWAQERAAMANGQEATQQLGQAQSETNSLPITTEASSETAGIRNPKCPGASLGNNSECYGL